jgi:hypothetical protein
VRQFAASKTLGPFSRRRVPATETLPTCFPPAFGISFAHRLIAGDRIMNDRQLRMLHWVSTSLGKLANPEIRYRLTDAHLEAMLTRIKAVVNAELALEATNEVEEIGAARDVEELEKIYSL